jgi:hypothetical protein
MSRSLRTLRLWVVLAAILASNACTANPFAPGGAGDAGGAFAPPGGKLIPDPCSDSANVGTPLCRYRH